MRARACVRACVCVVCVRACACVRVCVCVCVCVLLGVLEALRSGLLLSGAPVYVVSEGGWKGRLRTDGEGWGGKGGFLVIALTSLK